MSRLGVWATAAVLLAGLVLPAQAYAQFTVFQQRAPARPSRGTEFDLTAIVGPRVSFGQVSADLIDPGGGTLPLFITENSQGPEFGVAAAIAGPVRARWFAEVGGSATRARFETRIVDDFEGAAETLSSVTFYRFGADAGVGYNLVRTDRLAIFVKGSGGWVRELAGEAALAQNGAVVNAGMGVKYWAEPHRPGRLRYGLKVEGRLAARWKGLVPSTKDVVLAPVITAGLIIGS